MKEYNSRPEIKEKRELEKMANDLEKEILTSLNQKKVLEHSLPQSKKYDWLNQSGSGKIRLQFYGKKSTKMIKVPANVKKWAMYAFKLKKMGFKGATNTGWRRAKQLSTKECISIEDLRFMRNWYARHYYTSYPGFKKWVKAGKPKDKSWHNKHAILSWITWGGNAGFKWVNSDKNIKILNAHFNKNYKKIK